MNPWWKRPSPGDKTSRQKRSGATQSNDQPSRLGDTLQDADDISEIEGDLFEDPVEKSAKKRKPSNKPSKKRRRRRSGGKVQSGTIGLVLCDLEAFAHTLNAEAANPGPFLEELWGTRTPSHLLAYSGGQGHSRLASAVSELGFTVSELEEDQIATKMAIDAMAAMQDMDSAVGVLLVADHPSLGPLCEHLTASGTALFVHRSEDNPLAQLCSLEQPSSGSGGRSAETEEASDDDEDVEDDVLEMEDRSARSERSEKPRRSRSGGRSKGNGQGDGEEASREEAPRRAREDDAPPRGRRGRQNDEQSDRPARKPRPSHAQETVKRDPMKVLDDAMTELISSGPMVVWATLLRQECQRQAPGFDETLYGFESFQSLLEEAVSQGRIEIELVEQTESYVVTAWTPAA
jgi:hypothetical protein